jgi:hypothetical protein
MMMMMGAGEVTLLSAWVTGAARTEAVNGLGVASTRLADLALCCGSWRHCNGVRVWQVHCKRRPWQPAEQVWQQCGYVNCRWLVPGLWNASY